jgi:hypothetical protein
MSASNDEELRQRLTRFYHAYAPEKLANIESVIESYRHKVPQLFAALEAKYGPEPAVPAKTAPVVSTVNTPTATAAPASNSPQPPPAALMAKASPMPPPVDTDHREVETRRYAQVEERGAEHGNPPPSEKLDRTASKRGIRFAGFAAEEKPPTPEAEPVRRREPSPQAVVLPPLLPPSQAEMPSLPVAIPVAAKQPPQIVSAQPIEATLSFPAVPESEMKKRAAQRSRLAAFYQHYAPEKVAQVDVALAAYRGREDLMFQLLEAKYGPEAVIYQRYEEMTEEAQTDRRLHEMINASIAMSPHTPKSAADTRHHRDAPFDYVTAAHLLGANADVFMFGPGNEKYAAAFLLMMHAIGSEALFDATRATLPMPAFSDRESTALDRFAFERILHYRFVWIDSWFKGLAIRNYELSARRALADELNLCLRETRYREYVRQQAFTMIVPIERERRQLVIDDETLRFAGLVSWFRKERDEALLRRIHESAEVIVGYNKAVRASPLRSALQQEQSEIQKVLRTAGLALRRSLSAPREASPPRNRAPSAGADARSPTLSVRTPGRSPTSRLSPTQSPPPYYSADRRIPSVPMMVTGTSEPAALSSVSVSRCSGSLTSRPSFLVQARRVAGIKGQFSNHGIPIPRASVASRSASLY